MIRVKNNNIRISQGETATLTYTGIRRDGVPYILAPRLSTDQALADRIDYAILAFVVRTGAYGKVVLEKYFDLEAPPMYSGKTDMTSGGFHKFSTNNVVSVSNVSEIIDKDKVYELNGSYFTRIVPQTGSVHIVPYQFRVSFSFTWDELKLLEPKEYIYDMAIYYGRLTKAELDYAQGITTNMPTGFPLIKDSSLQKIPLVTTHSFIVEESSEPS